MKTLVLYDTFFGNTEKIAVAIGEALGEDTQVLRIKDASNEQVKGLDLLIVGSPTRGFRPTKDTTNWLNKLPAGFLNGVKVAAFDTRMDVEKVNNKVLTFMERIFGYAAKPIVDRLQKKGGNRIAEPEGFIVEESEGPLRIGELERAAEWAKKLA